MYVDLGMYHMGLVCAHNVWCHTIMNMVNNCVPVMRVKLHMYI